VPRKARVEGETNLMPQFFIPGGDSRQKSEEVYQWICGYVREMIGWEINPARIYSLSYARDGEQFVATVGQPDPRTGQLVVAILQSNTYLICTPSHGVYRGEPIQVAISDVSEVQYFEGLDYVREKLRAAVAALDDDSGTLQSRVQTAAATLGSVPVDEFPPEVVGDFVSLKHKLAWRGTQEETIRQMSDAEAEDAMATIRALFVDALRIAPAPQRAANDA
jgi:hypothetical protein